MDQEKEANPIEEIFDEVFTLLQDLETRSVAVLEYLQEQGGVTDEKLTPYLARAAAASDVRWRAARARMEHLLAPKPKSATEVGKDEKTTNGSQPRPQAKESEVQAANVKPQNEKQPGTRTESKDIGKELASAQPGAQESSESKDAKSQNTKPSADANIDQKKASDNQQGKEATTSQASLLGGEKNSDASKTDHEKNQKPQSDDGKSGIKSPNEEQQQTRKAAK